MTKSKCLRWLAGQRGLMHRVRKKQWGAKTVWIHCSSLGEWAVARPVAEGLKGEGHEVVLTFFSPTGFNHVPDSWPLPLDVPWRAWTWVHHVRPRLAIMMVSERWPMHTLALRLHKVPMIRVGAKGAKEGSPLWDSALSTASQPWANALLEEWRGALVAGSVSTGRDVDLLAHLLALRPERKLIVVPHEVHTSVITTLRSRLGGTLYTDLSSGTPTPKDARVLIVDTVGMLAHLYRYGAMAYVGGGFRPPLHSVLEPCAYGLPVAFGPMTRGQVGVKEMLDAGVGTVVRNEADLVAWADTLTPSRLENIRPRALTLMATHAGATSRIMNLIKTTLQA